MFQNFDCVYMHFFFQIETCVSTIYEFPGVKSDNSILVPVKGVHLSVQCTWSVTEAVLEPLPAECICFAVSIINILISTVNKVNFLINFIYLSSCSLRYYFEKKIINV